MSGEDRVHRSSAVMVAMVGGGRVLVSCQAPLLTVLGYVVANPDPQGQVPVSLQTLFLAPWHPSGAS